MTDMAIMANVPTFPFGGMPKVGIIARLSAHLFGSPDICRAYGGYRRAASVARNRRGKGRAGAGDAPVFYIDMPRRRANNALPKVWLTEMSRAGGDAVSGGRALTLCYPSDADKGGGKALRLAERYFAEGLNVTGDAAETLRIACFQAAELLYMHAMKRGNLAACTRLGVLYRFDMCCGSYMKDVVCKRGKHAKVPSAQESAFKLFRKAAMQGDAEAMVQLGEMLREGAGCPKNESVAFKFFKSAIRKCTGMDFRHIEGSVLSSDGRRAVHVVLAADLASCAHVGNAALHIAECFEAGRGTGQSFKAARNWYEVAYDALALSFDHGFWYSKRNKYKARQGYLRALQEINGKY